jgi:iron complex outermembrane recepter protein
VIKRQWDMRPGLVVMLLALPLVCWGANAGGPQGPDAAAPAASSDSGDQLTEIIVTANRREENQQTVPIAITAFQGDAVTKIGITDAMVLGESIPNVVFNRQSNGSIPFIRGVGNPNSTPGDEPSVATYVDDVYMPLAGSGISNYNSIERMEVEKGPQGTLFGRNATGGVIQIYTRDPSSTPEFEATEGYANYHTVSGSLYASGPLVDTVTANAAAYGSHQYKGWGLDLTTGAPTFGDEYDFGGRVKVLWTPNDRTSFLLNVDTDTTGTSVGITYNATPGTKTVDLSPLGFPVPGASAPSPANFYNNYGNFTNYSTNYQSGISLKATVDLTWAKFISISAYRHNQDQEYFDYDDGPAPLYNAYLHGTEDTATQEFRLQSADSSALKWVGGFYYFGDTAGYVPINFQTLVPPIGVIPNFISSYGTQVTNSYAGFGQVTDEVLPKTFLTIGIRETTDLRRGNGYNTSELLGATNPPTFLLPICPPGAPNTTVGCYGGSGQATFTKPSGKISIDYHFTDDFMVYIAANRGFKSGVFNVVTILSPLDPPVKPEILNAYTIGEKGEFLDHRLRINSEAFLYKFQDIQEQVIVQDSSHAVNAAAATMFGLELDVTAVPIAHLDITAALGVENGYFNNYPNGAYNVYSPVNGGNPCVLSPISTCGLVPGGPGAPPNYNGTTWNLAGNKTPNTPPFSSSLSAKYDIPTAFGTIDVNAIYNHIDGYFFNPDNGRGQIAPSSPQNNKQPISNLVNASVGWTSLNDKLAVRAWGKNLTGQHYYAFSVEDGNATQYTPAPPLTFGIALTERF